MKNSDSETTTAKTTEYKPFSVTTGKGFINGFKRVKRDKGDDFYFVRISLITGKDGSGEDAKSRIQWVDLLIGTALRSMAKKAVELGDADTPLDNLLVNFTIHNLHFEAVIASGKEGDKPCLNNQGVLQEMSIAYT